MKTTAPVGYELPQKESVVVRLRYCLYARKSTESEERQVLSIHSGFVQTEYVEVDPRLVQAVAREYGVDESCLYATGQSMGGMTLLYLSAKYRDLFAKELFVSSQWDINNLSGLVGQNFFYIV